MRSTEYTMLDCEIVTETDRALFIKLEEQDRSVWIPLSQIGAIHRKAAKDGRDQVAVAAWIVRKENLLA